MFTPSRSNKLLPTLSPDRIHRSEPRLGVRCRFSGPRLKSASGASRTSVAWRLESVKVCLRMGVEHPPVLRAGDFSGERKAPRRFLGGCKMPSEVNFHGEFAGLV